MDTLAKLLQEQQVFILEGNDYMVNKIQEIIDHKRNSVNLNEVVLDEKETNTQNLNEQI